MRWLPALYRRLPDQCVCNTVSPWCRQVHQLLVDRTSGQRHPTRNRRPFRQSSVRLRDMPERLPIQQAGQSNIVKTGFNFTRWTRVAQSAETTRNRRDVAFTNREPRRKRVPTSIRRNPTHATWAVTPETQCRHCAREYRVAIVRLRMQNYRNLRACAVMPFGKIGNIFW